jgi:hypothetical protein
MKKEKKDCENCINCLTDDDYFADSCLEEDERGHTLFRHFSPGDRVKRLMELEEEGKINQVVGVFGEYEINANWSLDDAYEALGRTCEICGGSVGHYGDYLILFNSEGAFKIFKNGKGKLTWSYAKKQEWEF